MGPSVRYAIAERVCVAGGGRGVADSISFQNAHNLPEERSSALLELEVGFAERFWPSFSWGWMGGIQKVDGKPRPSRAKHARGSSSGSSSSNSSSS